MFCCKNIKQVLKEVMFLTLLMFTTFLQAESSDDADVIDSAAQAETGLKSTADQQPAFKFPSWPERQQATTRQMIPPPPPGPYMSSALSDLSVKGPSFGTNSEELELNEPLPGADLSNVPMETFNPDRPWPQQRLYKNHKHECPPACSPSRWMPDNGYQYVKPDVTNKFYPVERNRLPGLMRAPDMNWPAGSRLPSMGKAPYGAYPDAPNYAPGNNFAPRYNAPMN